MSWIETVRKQRNDLELIASWASQVNLGQVRDCIREAAYHLSKEEERLELQEPVIHSHPLTPKGTT